MPRMSFLQEATLKMKTSEENEPLVQEWPDQYPPRQGSSSDSIRLVIWTLSSDTTDGNAIYIHHSIIIFTRVEGAKCDLKQTCNKLQLVPSIMSELPKFIMSSLSTLFLMSHHCHHYQHHSSKKGLNCILSLGLCTCARKLQVYQD